MSSIRPNSTSEREKRRRGSRFGVLLLATALLAASCSSAKVPSKSNKYDIEKKYTNGPVAVTVRIDRKEISLADTVRLEIEAVFENGWEIALPRIGSEIEGLTVSDYGTSGPEATPDRKMRLGKWYRLEPFLSGDQKIPPFKVEFYKTGEKSPEKHSVETEEITVTVEPLLAEDREKLKDILPIADVASLPPPGRLWIIIVASAVLLAGGSMAVWVMLARRKGKGEEAAVKADPPHVAAFRRMQELIDAKLIEKGLVKEFYVGLSDAVRRYIEDRFGLRAPERTTEEFLYEVSSGNSLQSRETEMLKRFLTHCDLVKFAKHEPSREEIQKSFDLAKEFVNNTKLENV